ncbi:MAG: metallophosphoesterase family protein [Clostridiales bacterium]|nr:metallophosphoesterase family protein [Clostridiales bacterium]
MKKKLSVILSVLLVFALLTGSFSTTVSAKKSVDKTLKFGSDGKFTILQFTDMHNAFFVFPIMREFIKEAIDRVQPDLVVLTGDNISGRWCNFGTKAGDKLAVTTAFDGFMSIFEEAGIPTAMIFGNHDDQGTRVTKEEQMAIYNKYSCSLGVDDGDALYGCGTYNLPILSSDGRRTAYNLWMFDSNSYIYDDNGEELAYDYVHQDQLDWYVKTSNKLKADNGGRAVPSMVFQHIIVPEIWDAILEVPEGTEGAVDYRDKYYVLDPEITVPGSVMREHPCPPDENSGEFDCIKAQGDVTAMFFGHDHTNNFSIKYQGIDLVCTPCAGFNTKGYEDCRAARVIELDEKDLSTYSTHVETFLDYFGDQPDQVVRYNIYKQPGLSKGEQAKVSVKNALLYICMFPVMSVYRLFKNLTKIG